MHVSSEAHILLIAPEPAGIADLLALLRTSFARISFALDAQQGLARCQSLQPDFVLSEYHLPGLRGDTFMRMLRANPQTASIPVVFLSAVLCADSQLMALRSGARDFIAYQTHVQLVIERIRLHLGLREMEASREESSANKGWKGFSSSSAQHYLVDAVQQYVRDNLSDYLTVDSLAERFGTTARRLNELFKESGGLTVRDFVYSSRMRYAMHLLRQTDMAITNVAAESGYLNPANFATAFRRCSGLSPSVYRQHKNPNI
ncbi:MAG: helix-turn-helix domain-containing protein [Alcaligenes faecalis]|jgi:AraC-like DNA-binding protein|uniref:response regulator transcription factor n=1 Tax=Alcaligenes aquatilis TaxID=323284 RepID=UPI000F68D0EA|nr:helix-turn-helix domain-containing protein [Alcaligenes aquatilis]MCH4224237.1 helix-turn-helix domain-containing protein [Alcaligenes faecalis]QXR36309.1 helix-turn-helix domain-containing protein [Alcaligenes aquatilis]